MLATQPTTGRTRQQRVTSHRAIAHLGRPAVAAAQLIQW
jgi:hypothetical protein